MSGRSPETPLVAIHAGNAQLTSTMQFIQRGEPNSTSLLVDPGIDLSEKAKLSSPWFHLALSNGFATLFRGGLMPLVPGLWNKHLPGYPKSIQAAAHMLRSSQNFTTGQVARAEAQMRSHAELGEQHTVVVSQPHLDSVNMMPYLSPDTQILATGATKTMLASWEQESPDPEHEFATVVERWNPKVKSKYPRSPRKFQEVAPGEAVAVGGFSKVLLTATSHILGSAAVDVTYKNGVRMVYSGDLGAGDATESFIASLEKERPDLLALDSTNIAPGYDAILNQTGLAARLNSILQRNTEHQQGNWIAELPKRHLERLAAFIEVAQRTRRKIMIPLEMAFYLSEMQNLREKYPQIAALSDVGIYLTPQESNTYKATDYLPALRPVAYTAENTLKPGVLTVAELAEQMKADRMIVVVNDPSDIRHLGGIGSRKSVAPVAGRAYQLFPTRLISADYPKTKKQRGAWRASQVAAGVVIAPEYELHLSDHLAREALIDLVARVQPRVLIPLHTLDPGEAAEAYTQAAPKTQIIKHVSRSQIYEFGGGKTPFRKAKL